MHPFRIAILIFVVGATCGNLLVLKLREDRIWPVSLATPAPTSTDPFDAVGTPTPNLWAVPTPDPMIYVQERQGQSRQAMDKALIAQVGILTIAGVAWFLMKPRQKL
jgi:hypothetical protein